MPYPWKTKCQFFPSPYVTFVTCHKKLTISLQFHFWACSTPSLKHKIPMNTVKVGNNIQKIKTKLVYKH